ncbi:MAG: aminotransferase class I/II-fold pyridoxal phosphate-dependent enzyme [Actinomycetes bacterium]
MNSQLTKNIFKEFSSHQKNVSSLSDAILRSNNFSSNNYVFTLLPVTKLDLENVARIELLANGRRSFQDTFPSRFNITFEGTRNWLSSAVIDNPNRLLYWITDQYLNIIGHIGLVYNPQKNIIEVDNVMRLKPDHKGLMSDAILALEKIAEVEFSIEEIYLLVLDTNLRAQRFYESLGYINVERIPHAWEEQENGKKLIPSETGSEFIIQMKKNVVNNLGIPDQILTAGPSISNYELVNTVDAVMNGWNNKHSDYIKRFESEFAEYTGSKYAMATSSCTGALHLALLAAGIGPNDEVIVPDITWVATASAIRYVGAKPIFADVGEKDWTLDVTSLNDLLTSRTKAIIPVHLYGYSANISKIVEFATINNLIVIEDAAPAIGTTFNNQKVGTYGDIGCFSFQGAKLLVTGEGGMLVTNDKNLYERAYKIQDHGRRPGTFWIETLGYKYKMNNLTASFGLGQLAKVENQIYRKSRINIWYKELLSDIESIKFQEEIVGSSAIHWMTSFTIDPNSGISRDELISALAKEKIDTRPVFPSISQYKIWGYDPKTPLNSKFIGDNGINLPSGVNLSRKSVEKVASEIRKIIV